MDCQVEKRTKILFSGVAFSSSFSDLTLVSEARREGGRGGEKGLFDSSLV